MTHQRLIDGFAEDPGFGVEAERGRELWGGVREGSAWRAGIAGWLGSWLGHPDPPPSESLQIIGGYTPVSGGDGAANSTCSPVGEYTNTTRSPN